MQTSDSRGGEFGRFAACRGQSRHRRRFDASEGDQPGGARHRLSKREFDSGRPAPGEGGAQGPRIDRATGNSREVVQVGLGRGVDHRGYGLVHRAAINAFQEASGEPRREVFRRGHPGARGPFTRERDSGRVGRRSAQHNERVSLVARRGEKRHNCILSGDGRRDCSDCGDAVGPPNFAAWRFS